MKKNAPSLPKVADQPKAATVTPIRRFSIARMPLGGRPLIAISPKPA